MGLFDKLKNSVSNVKKEDVMKAMGKAADFVTDSVRELERVAEDAVESARNAQRTSQRTAYQEPQNDTMNADTWRDYSLQRSRGELLADMKDMIARNIPDCEVVYDVPASQLDPWCHPACTPIQFMFKKNGAYVLAVAIVRNNTYRGMNVRGTQMICEKMRIPYIRFFEEMPNLEEYVIPRIKSYLK